MNHSHDGRCLCGAVRYRVAGPLRDVVFCHCSQCRRQSGLYFAATACAAKDLTVLQGGDALRWYASSDHARRGFCGTCGSALFWTPVSGTHVAILAGSLDDASGLRPAMHVCTEGRATFYALADGLPQYSHDGPGVPVAPR
jgi:hypothetical protein